ncbi:MAG: phosphatase PAP2 family protein [Patescibacteria group bacterium]
MNTQIFLLINNAAGRWPWLDRFMVFSAEYLMWAMVLVLLVLLATNYNRWKKLVLVSFVSAIVARGIIASIIKYFYSHPRPYWTIVETHLLLAKETQSSFPSGHTIFVFALATGVYLYNKKWGGWYILLACLVGFSRVFVGVHWPLDIMAGAVLGIATALVCNWGLKKYKYVV